MARDKELIPDAVLNRGGVKVFDGSESSFLAPRKMGWNGDSENSPGPSRYHSTNPDLKGEPPCLQLPTSAASWA